MTHGTHNVKSVPLIREHRMASDGANAGNVSHFHYVQEEYTFAWLQGVDSVLSRKKPVRIITSYLFMINSVSSHLILFFQLHVHHSSVLFQFYKLESSVRFSFLPHHLMPQSFQPDYLISLLIAFWRTQLMDLRHSATMFSHTLRPFSKLHIIFNTSQQKLS
jgi:hypothetical protein